jgi:hypothetical protein
MPAPRKAGQKKKELTDNEKNEILELYLSGRGVTFIQKKI